MMHLITLKNWSADDIRQVVEEGIALKRDASRGRGALAGRALALLFQKTSTRTRCAGEVGMGQLGGQAVYLDWRASNFGLADLGDEIRVLSTYVDFILARLLRHDDVNTVARAATVPVMNGCCDRYHPLQILADLQTIQERLGRLEGIKLTYTGVHNNVCNSLIAAGLKIGMEVTVVAPEMNEAAVDDELLTQARSAGTYKTSDDLRHSLERSDAVYTDTWLDMEYFDNPEFSDEQERRVARLLPYQLNRRVLEGLDLLVMHCLPAHRGYEIEGELIDDPRSVLFDQAENRLHSQKAALLQLADQPA